MLKLQHNADIYDNYLHFCDKINDHKSTIGAEMVHKLTFIR